MFDFVHMYRWVRVFTCIAIRAYPTKTAGTDLGGKGGVRHDPERWTVLFFFLIYTFQKPPKYENIQSS